MSADNIVLFRLDGEAGVFLRDAFHCRQQRRQIFNISGISADGIKQRLTLIAVALVAHIEDVFQFGIMRKHTVIKVCGQFRTGRSEQRNSGFNGGDSG
ncbi:hypothetical protein SRABI106_03976 [Rahnella aquatilis]|nr:hypothetical protein SRABI106_03976 [Rahnella aquatilis]